MIVKKHWLFGDCKFNVDVQEEDKCGECIHWCVCQRIMEYYCLNYCFGTSQWKGCGGCIHRFTRHGKKEDIFPCFKCKYFKKNEVNGNV